MNFVICLTILNDFKRDTYNLILVIGNKMIKMSYYKPVKIIIDIVKQIEFSDGVMKYHDLSNFIVKDKYILFTSNSDCPYANF